QITARVRGLNCLRLIAKADVLEIAVVLVGLAVERNIGARILYRLALVVIDRDKHAEIDVDIGARATGFLKTFVDILQDLVANPAIAPERMPEQSVSEFTRHLAGVLEYRRHIDRNYRSQRRRQGSEVAQIELVVIALELSQLAGISLRDELAHHPDHLAHMLQRLAILHAERIDQHFRARPQPEYQTAIADQIEIHRVAGGLQRAARKRQRDTGAQFDFAADSSRSSQ